MGPLSIQQQRASGKFPVIFPVSREFAEQLMKGTPAV
jgi:hypothetical protein